MATVLIIEDDLIASGVLADVVDKMGHKAVCAFTLNDGLRAAASGECDVVFLDVRLPDGNGLEALPRIAAAPSSPEVIIMTGRGDPDGAELAIKSGAWDYIEKPGSMKALMLPLARALQYREERQARSQKTITVLNREGIVGNSPKTKASLEILAQAAGSEANVLITGETGTGKELFAWAVHINSARADKKFVVVDCGSLPETLVESMLFGHEKGAFTGADRPHEGFIRQADGGTLFLDEVGELPLSIQKSFLRVLQERRFRPLGGKTELASGFRLIAATNQNLEEMVQKGQFRKDLLFRIRSLAIELPPLRERPEDIKELVVYHVARYCEHYGIGMKGFSPEFFDVLAMYNWPGNVRELVNTAEATLIAARDEPTLFPRHLPSPIRIHAAKSSLNHSDDNSDGSVEGSYDKSGARKAMPPLKKFLDGARRHYLKDLMALTEGDVQLSCDISGISRAGLYAHLKKYKIPFSR